MAVVGALFTARRQGCGDQLVSHLPPSADGIAEHQLPGDDEGEKGNEKEREKERAKEGLGGRTKEKMSVM